MIQVPTNPPGLEVHSLLGKVALVLGGAGAIGAATTQLLADSGATVVVGDLDQQLASEIVGIRESGGRVSYKHIDVLDFDRVDAVTAEVIEEYGRLDILVYMVGWAALRPSVDVELSEFRRTLDVNLTGQFAWARSFASVQIAAQSPGSVVLMGSLLGSGGVPLRAAYTASRGGLVQLVRTLAVEWAPHGIRVNAVAPGWVDTPPFRGLGLDVSAYEQRSPMQRLGQPEDIAGPVQFLASAASRWITGVTLPVDGGTSAYIGAGNPNAESQA